ncbi:M48 family metallopeptidase [uncultured Psychrosphaera sp.]|uniref:YgjP-like metallopeptidase domain-containing protein n=1 Tax=uncultured Psychrosphaera sp. TaxID=1403522 RepID=UPI00262FA807|nr:M48 family metallopeptidase [uncultured Psychrosphaera sp.]
MSGLPYLNHYSPSLVEQIQGMLQQNKLQGYIDAKYPDKHNCNNDKQLRDYVMEIKNQYLKKSAPINKIQFDNKLHVVKNALGTHTYVSRVQGSKLKSKNELRVSSIFKDAPEAFLRMIVVHELAHVKELDHNKAFYKLCCHMLPEYHQIEFDTRVYLTLLEHQSRQSHASKSIASKNSKQAD